MLKIVRIMIAVMLVSISICAQQTTGWDLTYKSVLERNNVGKSEWIWPWLDRDKSPAADWIANWEGKPVVSSILIEHPAFHAAEHTTIWLIRTNDEAFYWGLVEGGDQNEEPIAPQIYDVIYQKATAWQQFVPKPAKELRKGELPGFVGFISHQGPSGSKQMLLTMDDFFICLDKSCLPGKIKSGRLFEALEPVFIPESVKNYKHKSEAEIARMTPEQRIDEQIKEHDHMLDASDKQSDLIQKYRRMDGLKGSEHLANLIESYHPKRLRDSRSELAVMMANGIDEGIVRLRASPEGRSVIEAIERVSARMVAAGKKYSYAETELPRLKGINFTDRAVRDTLWVKYRIEVSDGQLLGFSNYLVQNDPTYPAWSKRDYMKDYSRINEAGNPFQVYVMKSPERFHRAYLKFSRP
jgi:hypothetical protein